MDHYEEIGGEEAGSGCVEQREGKGNEEAGDFRDYHAPALPRLVLASW